MDSIADATCAYYGIKKSDIIGKRKNKLISNARQMAIYLINDMLEYLSPLSENSSEEEIIPR